MGYTKYSIEGLMQWLENNLTQDRFEHSVGTAQCAQDLALKYNLDSQKAYIAGLLHDCAKCFPKEKLLEIIETHLTIDPSEKTNYKTWHAPVSSYVAKETFGIEDFEILSAIRWHTIGKVDMTTFEKIIFLADKIETKTREAQYAQPIRDLLSEDNGLDKAILECYKLTIKSLIDRDLKICPMTIEIYNCYEEKIRPKSQQKII